MARLSQAEVLRRYQAGERDFRGADLSGLQFRGQTLAGVDFSGTDLRGTDFLEADLRRATFVGARFGLSMSELVQMLLGVLIGICFAFYYTIAAAGLIAKLSLVDDLIDVGFSCIDAFGFVAFAASFASKGFSDKGLVRLAFIFGLGFQYSVYLGIDYMTDRTQLLAFLISSFGSGIAAVSFAVLGGMAGASIGAFSVAGAIGIGLGVVGVAASVPIAIATGRFGDILPLPFSAIAAIEDYKSFALTLPVTGFILLLFAWISAMSFRSSRGGAQGYVFIRASLIGSIAGIGGTSFRSADLKGSCFGDSSVAQVNFKDARLNRVCWKGAQGLEMANVSGTILADPRCRSLLLSGSAPGADLRGLNLRGAYLHQADLRGADLREANLCEAELSDANLKNANLKASQCLGTELSGAHLTGATLEGWNIDHATKLDGVDCAYVYLLEPLDELGQRRDDHDRERLPHDPDKSFGPGDFEVYFKHVVEEVKLLFKNGVDAKALMQALQEVMRQHPQITSESIGFSRNGNDVLMTLHPTAPVDKGVVEQTLFNEYTPLKMENARLKAMLEGERRVGEVERQRAEDHRNHVAQLVDLTGRLMPPINPASAPASVIISPVFNPVMGNLSASTKAPAVTTTTIQAGDGNLINTGSFNTAGGMVNLGALSDLARISIEALPGQRSAEGEPTLRELLQELKASVDADTQVQESDRAEALTEVTELAKAAQDPQKNVGPARRAINTLKSLNAGLTETNKAVEESSKLVGAIKRLLPLIAAFFVG
jgi:uncharacterized protein YjbI with pentapeptide repeats